MGVSCCLFYQWIVLVSNIGKCSFTCFVYTVVLSTVDANIHSRKVTRAKVAVIIPSLFAQH